MKTRRPYLQSDYAYIEQHYPDTPAVAVAAHLGRPVGSLYQFVKRHPHLQKRPRL